MDMFNEMPEVQGVILCASSAYEEKYYFNRGICQCATIYTG